MVYVTSVDNSPLQDLARQGLSHVAIARRTGLQRVTVARWLAAQAPGAPSAGPVPQTPVTAAAPAPPAEAPPAGDAGKAAAASPAPPPWARWEQVAQVRAALKTHRWLVLRRPDHLTAEQQAHIAALIASPVGEQIGVARSFLVEWYALWRTEDGQRRPLAEAQERYDRWRSNPAYQAVLPLHKVQALITPARFARLSQFLRHAHWEATNKGAERAGRAFRHGQAPHVRLRTRESSAGVLRVVTAQTKEHATTPPVPLRRLCPRGRVPRSAPQTRQVA